MSKPLPIELAIWKELGGTHLSVSHDRWHIDRVLTFALQLHALYGGDREVLTAAALMHDLGRSDPGRQHGLDSVEASRESAESILKSIKFPPAKARAVLDAISQHDQPEVRPTSIEAKILKDADFLAGFGAWGLLRIAMWSGETGRNTNAVLNRLQQGMRRRLASLEFPESVSLGRKEMFLTELFIKQLETDPTLPSKQGLGRYVLIEGISGSGKDSQARLLAERIEAANRRVEIVKEPGEDYRYFREGYESASGGVLRDSPDVKKWLMIASRAHLMRATVKPALDRGAVVLGIRGFISTLVYQCVSDEEAADAAYLHRNFPQPNMIVLLDIPAAEARRRIESRDKPEGDYESLEELETYRKKYKDICAEFFFNETRIIDGTGSESEVAERVWTAVSEVLPGDSYNNG